MSEDLVQPIPGIEAFSGPAVSRTMSVSQAMQVICVGAQLSGHGALLEPDGPDDRGVVRELDVPGVAPLGDRVVGERECAEYVAARYGAEYAGAVSGRAVSPPGTSPRLRALLWLALRENDQRENDQREGDQREGDRQVAAVAFLRSALHADAGEDDLLTVVGASELTWLASNGSRARDPRADSEAVIRNALGTGLASESEDVRLIATNALSGLQRAWEGSTGRDQAGTADVETEEGDGGGAPASAGPLTGGASTIIHGTWANKGKTEEWWRPSTGAFHTYLSAHPLGTGLYSGDDPYGWSGEYDDYQREVAGSALRWWTNATCGTDRLNAAFAHSHGGTVLQWTVAHRRLRLGLMVALACPDYAWSPAESRAIAERVDAVVSVRAKHDMVLMADRWRHVLKRRSKVLKGAHDLPVKGVGHSDLHDPALWAKHGIADRVLVAAMNLGWTP